MEGSPKAKKPRLENQKTVTEDPPPPPPTKIGLSVVYETKVVGFSGGDWADDQATEEALKVGGVGAILSLCDGEEAPRHATLPFLHIEIPDEADADLLSHFEPAIKFIGTPSPVSLSGSS